jgi:xanthine dehydrogenase/oxidase
MVPVRYNIHAFAPMPFYCHVSVFEGDGTIAVSHGGIEMGQGINTKVAQTVAKELGVSMDIIVVKPADNVISPNNCVTGGSTTSELTCHVHT